MLEEKEITNIELENLIYEYGRSHDLEPGLAEEEFMKVYGYITGLGWSLVR